MLKLLKQTNSDVTNAYEGQVSIKSNQIHINKVNIMLQVEIKSDTFDLEVVQNLVRAAIDSEIRNLKRSIDKTNKLLKEFETKYQVLSDFFLSNWTAEDLEGRDEEYVNWVGEIKIKQRLESALQKLEEIEYVTQYLPK